MKVFARKADKTELSLSDTSIVSAYMRDRNTGNFSKLSIADISKIHVEGESGQMQSQPIKVLFLMDLSGSMRGTKLIDAKAAIRTVLFSGKLDQAQVEFAWFHDDISPSERLTQSNFDRIVDLVDIGPEGKDTDLYRAIQEKIQELSSFSGQKVIILLTDGRDDTKNNPIYNGDDALVRISSSELYTQLSGLDSTFQIFPVGVGLDADEGFLQNIVKNTASHDDYYSFGVAPEKIGETFRYIIESLKPNWKLSLSPPMDDAIFGPERREFRLVYGEELVTYKSATLGSATHYVDFRASNQSAPILEALFGLGFLVILFIGLRFLIPVFSSQQFKKNYIRHYHEVKEDGRIKRDPLTNDPYQDSDEVVVMNNKMMLYETWKYFKEHDEGIHTTEYAEFFQFHSDAKLFQHHGAYGKLNWFLAGAFGGWLAWIFIEMLGTSSFTAVGELLKGLDTESNQISGSILIELITGPALGLCIVGALAAVEEATQGRKFNLSRVLLRMAIGLLAGALIFFLEGAFIATVLPYRYPGSLMGWLIFGTAVGYIVTLFSGIESKNGLKGGLIASVIAFHIYYFFNLPFISAELGGGVAKVLSLILFGGILGFVLFTVVTRLEDFELRCLSPKAFMGRTIPISKWLKSPSIDYIHIGKHPDCYVYLKWEDHVAKPWHAKISYEREVVYLEPDEGSVLLNGQRITHKVNLNNEDKIQLGENSVTIFQFLAKAQEGKKGGKYSGKGYSYPQSGRRTSINVERRKPGEVKKIRSNITVSRKN